MRIRIAILIFLTLLLFVFRNAEAHTLTFTVTTVTDNGPYSPKHVLAIWVEDNNGNFVKTLKKNASQREQYLYTWKSKSAGNVVDAVTGATLTAHTTHTVQWNCTNMHQQQVPDGTYRLFIEFTDYHSQGPVLSISFNVGNFQQYFQPPDQTYFKSITLDFTPQVTSAGNLTGLPQLIVYPNPNNGRFTVRIPYRIKYEEYVHIYDQWGRLVLIQPFNESNMLQVNITKLQKGVYFARPANEQFLPAMRIIVE